MTEHPKVKVCTDPGSPGADIVALVREHMPADQAQGALNLIASVLAPIAEFRDLVATVLEEANANLADETVNEPRDRWTLRGEIDTLDTVLEFLNFYVPQMVEVTEGGSDAR